MDGLSSDKVAEGQKKFGYNEISEVKVNPFIKFLKYFWGPIPIMIEVAAILSVINNEWNDFWIIIVLLLLNCIVGFWEEHKADDAIEKLKKKLALNAKVLRDGTWVQIPARELVPDDIVRIRLGDIIPADVKFLEGEYLLVDESALTGESLPVEKKIDDTVYSGSIAKMGEMTGIVTSTGMNTYFGKTARLADQPEGESHFQKNVIKIGNYLIAISLILSAIIFIVSFSRHEDLRTALQFVLILTVASIPAALPAVLSITMAIGSSNLAGKGAIVRKMVAIEEMASMDILCVDKTGTITENKIIVGDIMAFKGYVEEDVMLYGVLCSKIEDMDPIDKAIFEYTKDIKYTQFKVQGFKPFDPVSKLSESTIKYKGETFKVAKGAPQAILALTGKIIDKKMALQVNTLVESFASKGYRTLGVARTYNNRWKYVGLISLYDPPRADSAETIKTATSMGVDVKIITGDHKAITKEIAQKMDLQTNIIDASALKHQNAYDELVAANGVAGVYPQDKYEIVKILQERHVVGMTGDGVNDAPALKKADVGIAVENSTDAAKSSADMVLTKSGISTIIDAMKESRNIFQRMNNYAIYRIAETMRIMLFIAMSIIFLGFYPISAIMIVLLVLLNDIPIMTIAYDNVKHPDKPLDWNMKKLLTIATFLGVVGVCTSFLLLYLGNNVWHLDKGLLQTLLFLKLAIAGHLLLFIARTKGPFWSIKPKSILLMAVIGTQIVATLIAVYGIFITPIGWGYALGIWLYAILCFLIVDMTKILFYKMIEIAH